MRTILFWWFLSAPLAFRISTDQVLAGIVVAIWSNIPISFNVCRHSTTTSIFVTFLNYFRTTGTNSERVEALLSFCVRIFLSRASDFSLT